MVENGSHALYVCCRHVETPELLKQLDLVEEVYQKVSADNKVKDMVLIDSFHSAIIEGART